MDREGCGMISSIDHHVELRRMEDACRQTGTRST